MARRFRSTRASGCLSVPVSGLIGHWSNIMTGHLDLICHRPMTALHVSQFTKRREREIERKEGPLVHLMLMKKKVRRII